MTTLDPNKLLAELKKQGLVVHEMAGWKSRGHGSLELHIIGVHDSVTGSMNDTRAAQFVYDGRSDLPGPDYNLIVGSNGDVWLVSAVRTWNIGKTNKSRVDLAWNANMPLDRELGRPPADDYLNGNNVVFGFAFRTEGAGPYTAKQYAVGVKAAAALGHALGWSASDTAKSCAGHGELTSRKVDPQFDMGKFRRDVQFAMTSHAPTKPTPPKATPPTTQAGSEMTQDEFNDHMDAYLDRRRRTGEKTISELLHQLPGLFTDVAEIKAQTAPEPPNTPAT